MKRLKTMRLPRFVIDVMVPDSCKRHRGNRSVSRVIVRARPAERYGEA
jgi:hypothetical protein